MCIFVQSKVYEHVKAENLDPDKDAVKNRFQVEGSHLQG